MERAQTVRIFEVCKVAPPPVSASSSPDPHSTSPKSLPLTFFDLIWLRIPPVQRLFFYEFPTLDHPNTNTTEFFHSLILPRLKHSLSLTLRHFLPLAGNLTWPESSHKPVVVYAEEDAVSLTVAESDADFNLLSGSEDIFQATEYHPLLPNLAMSHDRAAALALQVTLFPNSGFSIGMVTHHAILDGKTGYLFLKSWALTYRSCSSSAESSSASLPPELKPFYDRSVVKYPARLDSIYAKHWLDQGGPNNRSLMCWEGKPASSDLVRGTFQLTRSNIEKLRKTVINNQTSKEERQHPLPHISTFSLTYAYTLVCLLKAEGIIGNTKDKDKAIFMTFAADFRPRLDPPLPPTYFGSCVVGKLVALETKELVGKGFGLDMAVKIIGEVIKNLTIDGAEDWLSRFSAIPNASRFYSTAGSPRFEVYNIDYGWGKLRKMDVVSIDTNRAISFSDTRNGDGVEIGLVLKKRHMEAFASLFSQGLVDDY